MGYNDPRSQRRSGYLFGRLTITVTGLLATTLVVAVLLCQSLVLTHNHLDDGRPVAADCELCTQLTGAGLAAIVSTGTSITFESAVAPCPPRVCPNLVSTLRYHNARGPPATA